VHAGCAHADRIKHRPARHQHAEGVVVVNAHYRSRG
jgi:hypothetical protein